MAYVYILQSLKDGNLYTGSTVDLIRRLKNHNCGHTKSTAYRRPLKSVYSEINESPRETGVREKWLKYRTMG